MSSSLDRVFSVCAAFIVLAAVAFSVFGISSLDLAMSPTLSQIAYPAKAMLWLTAECVLGFGVASIVHSAYQKPAGQSMPQFVAILSSAFASYASFFFLTSLAVSSEEEERRWAGILVWGLVAVFISGYLLASKFVVMLELKDESLLSSTERNEQKTRHRDEVYRLGEVKLEVVSIRTIIAIVMGVVFCDTLIPMWH